MYPYALLGINFPTSWLRQHSNKPWPQSFMKSFTWVSKTVDDIVVKSRTKSEQDGIHTHDGFWEVQVIHFKHESFQVCIWTIWRKISWFHCPSTSHTLRIRDTLVKEEQEITNISPLLPIVEVGIHFLEPNIPNYYS